MCVETGEERCTQKRERRKEKRKTDERVKEERVGGGKQWRRRKRE